MEMKKTRDIEKQLKIVFPRGRIVHNSLQGDDLPAEPIDDIGFLFSPLGEKEEEEVPAWDLSDKVPAEARPPRRMYRITPKGAAHLRRKK